MHPKFNINRERNNHIYYCTYENDYCLFHFHSQIELYFVDEGKMEMLVAGKHANLFAGEMCVSLSHDAHAYKTPEHSRSSVFIIPTELAPDFLSELSGKRLASPYITDKETVAKIKGYIKLANTAKNKTALQGYINLILGELLETADLCVNDAPTDTTLLSKMLLFIEENYTNTITPSDIARHFGYSQSYVSRYFKAEIGVTLSEYIAVARLKHAAELILSGSSVTRAALDSGFGSTRAFYRAFVKEFGCTPKEYTNK